MQLQIADAKAHVLLLIIQEHIRICEEWCGTYGITKYKEILGGTYEVQRNFLRKFFYETSSEEVCLFFDIVEIINIII